jgi:hypothetical protein
MILNSQAISTQCASSGTALHDTSLPASDLELHQLRAFVALIENRSVTAASKTLNHAQSTASETIAALERALGTALTQPSAVVAR